MKIVLDVDIHGRLENQDILIYDGKIWSTISKKGFLRDLIIAIENLKINLQEANNRIEALEKQLKLDHGEIEEDELGTN